ncbi:MAG: alginate lyase family protein [Bacteroidales bacterium]|nr:alginate lyase family protein [Bacteroidales bacterium]
MKKLIVVIAVLYCVTTLSAQPFLTVSFDDRILIRSKEAIANNDPVAMEALQGLLESAERMMTLGPWTVTEKTFVPPSGDRRDYMTIAPFWWPNPETPDGLPYIRNDGVRNPQVFDFPERENLRNVSQTTLYLALAYYFTGEQNYAERATEIIRVWFLDEELGMNPNLNFGQAIRGINDGRIFGLIETRFLVKVVNGAMLLRGSNAWTNEKDEQLQAWFGNFLDWMEKSPLGRQAEARLVNNIGSFYEAQRVSFAIFSGQYDRARNIINNSVKTRIFYQQTEDGQMPLELVRTAALYYVTFNLAAIFQIATMADKLGIDLFNYVDGQGRSISKYIDFLVPFYTQEKEWQWQQIRPFDFVHAKTLLITAAEWLNNPKYAEAAEKIEGDLPWLVILTGQYPAER